MKKKKLSEINLMSYILELSKGDFTGDLNTIEEFGFYLIRNNALNVPIVTGGSLIVFPTNGSYKRIIQIFVSIHGNTYVRVIDVNIIRPWVKLS